MLHLVNLFIITTLHNWTRFSISLKIALKVLWCPIKMRVAFLASNLPRVMKEGKSMEGSSHFDENSQFNRALRQQGCLSLLLFTGKIFDCTNHATKFVLDSLQCSEKNLTSIRTLKTLKAWPNSHKKLSEQKMQLNHRIYTAFGQSDHHYQSLHNWTRFSILIKIALKVAKMLITFTVYKPDRFSVSEEISPHHQVCYDSFRCNAQNSKYLLKP